MIEHNEMFFRDAWRIIDRVNHNTSDLPIHSFAVDDTLCTFVGKNLSSPVIHIWSHDNTVVLGIRDARLPRVYKGIKFLQDAGYETIVRNSGGAAVVLDKNVLNLSVILPVKDPFSNIKYGYVFMYQLIKEILEPLGKRIDAGEIKGSYCPGRYDLGINGIKFAGIAQRRRREGVAVQAFLLVSGSGIERAELIKKYYELAGESHLSENQMSNVLQIDSHTMGSIADLTNQPVTVLDLKNRVNAILKKNSVHLTLDTGLKKDELDEYKKNLQLMYERNEILKEKDQPHLSAADPYQD
ncbi:lipoate--protein ligase family protein [Microaerobacter geothermalis]|uniref:lipoate--protein ligase family protein n=1 Tax=Microaerobacter geothermalis TaxID=674972 RepID=UPI001F2F272D|nr:lipoate--protein ligase family protein [Microaerobacter geothermalis]MCF6093104.1 lipoate--protein ligase family protein [Microaerobacter geothermalis]